MRLFLSSENLGNYPDVFLKMVGDGKLALIENAKDDWSEAERKTKAQEHIDQFSGQGFSVEEIDLRNYFGKANKLAKKIEEFDGVFAFGGNTFILRRSMAFSGFDKILEEKLIKKELTYGGSSAGSCVAAPSLHGMEIGDKPQPDVVPKNYPSKETIWKGLNLVNFYIVPHYKSDWFGAEAEAWVDYMQKNELSHYALKDGQVIVVDGDKTEFLK